MAQCECWARPTSKASSTVAQTLPDQMDWLIDKDSYQTEQFEQAFVEKLCQLCGSHPKGRFSAALAVRDLVDFSVDAALPACRRRGFRLKHFGQGFKAPPQNTAKPSLSSRRT
jgi:hypothetical protein